MTTDQRFERDLPDLLADLYLGSTPDYRDDVLARTSRMRQRPVWTFPERWLPMSVITLARNTLKPVPWRTVGVLALVAVLLAVAIAAYVGSQQRHLPPPFGRAVNGLVAYAKSGDIYIADPATGASRVVVAGPENDHDPKFSLDGTRLAFMRGSSDRAQVVIVDAGGQDPLVAAGPLLLELGDIAWSPDGRQLAVTSRVNGDVAITIVDTRTGVSRLLDVGMPVGPVSWRPPSGSELLFVGGTEPDLAIYLIKPDGSDRPRQIVAHNEPLSEVSSPWPNGWSPDGAQLTFHRGMPDGTIRTYVRDIASGTERELLLRYGRVSNDGKRIAALSEETTWVCVADLVGGPCTKISELFDPWGTDFNWSPDDRWIYVTRSDGAVFILDPDGGPQTQPSWLGEGLLTWQRTAPAP